MKRSGILVLAALGILLAGCVAGSERQTTPAPLSADTSVVSRPTATATIMPTQTAPTRPLATALPADEEELFAGPTPTALPLPTSVLQRSEPKGEKVKGVTATPENGASADQLFESPSKVVQSNEPAGESAHFTFYVLQGASAPPMDELAPKAEEIWDYISRRLGAGYEGPISVIFRQPSTVPCPARGGALPVSPDEEEGAPFIYVFANQKSSRDYVYGVLAHEVAHILHAFSDWNSTAGSGLTEGFAHWLSADYVNEWYGNESYEELVRGYLAEGTYRPLHEQYDLPPDIYPGSGNDDCIRLRDILYTEWGAFIGFLIDRYGMRYLEELMRSARTEESGDESIRVPVDFQGIYGLTLNQLEAQWLRELLGGQAGTIDPPALE